MEFQWDPDKAESNLKQHGVSFHEAATEDDLRPEYDLKTLLKNGVRGKYADRYREGTNLVLLAPDVACAFPTDDAVNEALRLVLRMAQIPVDIEPTKSRK